jgi:hypothetical protein
MWTDHFIKRKHCSIFEVTDAAAHAEHGLVIRCDIWPRSVEISQVDEWQVAMPNGGVLISMDFYGPEICAKKLKSRYRRRAMQISAFYI